MIIMQQRNKSYYLFHCLPIALLLIAGCKKPDFQAQEQAKATLQNVGDYINNNFDYTLFAAAIKKAGLMDSLNNPNAAYTVFVPTNEAFNADSIMSPSDFDKIPLDTLRYMVRSYILPQKLFYSDVPNNLDNLYANLNGIKLYISNFYQPPYNPAFYVDGVPVNSFQVSPTVSSFDVPEANAVIHVLSATMKVYSGTVQDFLAARPDLSDFVAVCKRFHLWDSLKTANPLTVFPVNNTGMESRGLTADSIAGMDTSQYYPILFSGYVQYPHHLFTGDLILLFDASSAAGISGGTSTVFPSASGDLFGMTAGYPVGGCSLTNAGGTYLGPISSPYGYAEITPFVTGGTDFACSNGVVHLLTDLVVLPSAVHK
jgi:hypothetical protein